MSRVIRADGYLTAGDTQVIEVGVAPPGLLSQPMLTVVAELWRGAIDDPSWRLQKTIPPGHRLPEQNLIEIHLGELDLEELPQQDVEAFVEIELRGPTIGVKTLPHIAVKIRAQRIL